MANSFDDFGIALTDPLGGDDSGLWLSFIYDAMDQENLPLLTTLIAARQFGQRIALDARFGARLSKPKFYADYFTEQLRRNSTDLLIILRNVGQDNKGGDAHGR
jgi:hypothetical protein